MFRHDDEGGPHFAFGWAGGPGWFEDEGWQPWARGPRGPRPPFFGGPELGRMLRHMARRWGFGPGFGFGPGGPGGPGPRMFGHGHLKYVLLDLLQERPKHGYELMKDLEQRTGGFYSPSAGAIYPTLQLLEDREWVTSQTADGKKVYTITDAGRAALKEHQERRGGPEPDAFGGPRHGPHHGHGPGHRGPFPGPWGREARPELHALRREAMEVVRLTRAAVLATGGDPERLARLRGIVEHARDELNAFLGQPTPKEAPRPSDATTPPSGETTPPSGETTPPDAGMPAGEGPIERV